MQQFLKFILFWINAVHVSDGLSVHHQELKTAHTATVYVKQLLLPAAKRQKIPQQVAAAFLHILLLYAQFWASDDGQKDCRKHVEHFTRINRDNRCMLLVVLWECITMHRPVDIIVIILFQSTLLHYNCACAQAQIREVIYLCLTTLIRYPDIMLRLCKQFCI